MSIIETLRKYDYKNVVIIDDKIEITDPAVTIEKLRELDNENLLNTAQLVKFRIPSIHMPYRELNNEELNKLIDSVFDNEKYLSLFVKDLNSFSGLIKKTNFDNDSDIRDLNSNILWIIDRKLERSYEGHIKKVISVYTNRLRDGHQDVLIFYTKELDQIKNYDDMKLFIKRQIDAEVSNEIMYINALSKDQPIDALYIERAIQKINKVRIFEMFSKNSDKSIEKIRQGLYDKAYYYDYLIDYDYLSEGKNAFKAFSHILFNTINNDFFSIDAEKRSVIDKTNDISNKKFQNCEEYDKFRTKLIGRIIKTYHKIINPPDIQKTFDDENDDIGFGDIFIIGSDYYLLIHQECDLVIREDGKRKSENLKLVKLKYAEIDDPNVHAKSEISRVIDLETQRFNEKFPDKDKNSIIRDAVVFIKQIDPEFPYSGDQLSRRAQGEKGCLVKKENKLALVNLDDSFNVIFVSGWLLDASVYSTVRDHTFILWSFVERNHKLATSLRIAELIKQKDEVRKESERFEVKPNIYLKVKTGLSIIENDSGETLIPIRRIARLPRDLTLNFIVELNLNESRKVVQDIITIP